MSPTGRRQNWQRKKEASLSSIVRDFSKVSSFKVSPLKSKTSSTVMASETRTYLVLPPLVLFLLQQTTSALALNRYLLYGKSDSLIIQQECKRYNWKTTVLGS